MASLASLARAVQRVGVDVVEVGTSYLGRPLKNQAPVFFHISRVSEQMRHNHISRVFSMV